MGYWAKESVRWPRSGSASLERDVSIRERMSKVKSSGNMNILFYTHVWGGRYFRPRPRGDEDILASN